MFKLNRGGFAPRASATGVSNSVVVLVGALAMVMTGSAVATNAKATAATASVTPQVVQRRDPTRPPGAPSRKANAARSDIKIKTKKPVLTSILLSDDRRLAVINDKLVREGEQVAGMTLVRVAKDEVQLRGKDQTRPLVLRLPKSNIGKDYR